MNGRSLKIFIRKDGKTTEVMWTDLGSDGSVMMGLLDESIEAVELVRDPVGGLISKPGLIAPPRVGRPKVTFHPSGKYKLTATMGLSAEALDRATVEGPPLAQISTPRRMLEVLLPRALPGSRSSPRDSDLVLTAQDSEDEPLRLTVSCMSKEEYRRISGSSGVFFVDTSRWECTGALDNESHTWSWTLRSTEHDKGASERFRLVLIGQVKWGLGSSTGQG